MSGLNDEEKMAYAALRKCQFALERVMMRAFNMDTVEDAILAAAKATTALSDKELSESEAS